MQQKKMTRNILYSIVIQISAFITSLITSPYIARVLSPELIGEYSYTLANSSYFALIEGMGLSLYGTIKVAKIRDSRQKTSQLFCEIVILKLILMCICSTAYVVWFLRYGDLHLRPLYWIMLINLIATGLDVTWFLNGLEEFKINAIRCVGVKIVNVILILVFVKDESDLMAYAIIMQASILMGYLAVYPTVFKKIDRVKIEKLRFREHFKCSFVYFVPGLINTIFSSTDKSILGAFTGESYEVGVYEQANKICQLCMGMISAISNAILPRAVYLNSNKKDANEARRLLYGSVRIALSAALPVSLGIAAISESFVPLFFGRGYEKSSLLLKILCFNVLFVTLTNFVGQQCLVARGKQKEYNMAITVSAILNVVLNMILVYGYKSVGVSFASALSSFCGFAMAIWFGRGMIGVSDLLKMTKKYIISAGIMYLIVFKINICKNLFATVGVQIILGGSIYTILLVLLKDELFCKIYKAICSKNKHVKVGRLF